MRTIRNLVIAGLALLVLAGGTAGCARQKLYLLEEDNPAVQGVNYPEKEFDFYKAEKMLRENPQGYGDWLKSLGKEK